MVTARRHASATAVADGSGRAAATVGPDRPQENWEIRSIATSITGSNVGALRVYAGIESPGTLIDGTHGATLDKVSLDPGELVLSSSERILFIWTDVTPGGTCAARVTYGHVS